MRLFVRPTGENEGDGENNKEAAVETNAEGGPGQSRLKDAEEKTKKNPKGEEHHEFQTLLIPIICSDVYSESIGQIDSHGA